MCYLYYLDLVKLVQSVEASHMCAPRARLTAEAGGVCHVLHRQYGSIKDHIAVDICYGHLSSGYQIKVINANVIHLPLLVGQIACAEARLLIDHYGRFNFTVAGLLTLVEEEVYECSLEPGTLALVDGKTRAGNFDPKVEINYVILPYQVPVGEGSFIKMRYGAAAAHHHVVIGAFPRDYQRMRQVGQPDQFCLHLV